jgi:predicted O-methyltransferase YrrM
MIDLLNPDKDALSAELKATWEKHLAAVTPLNKWDRDVELYWWAEWSTRCTDIIELGAYSGASTLIMLLANPTLKIHVIDLWEDTNTHETFLEHVAEPFKDRVTYDRRSTEEGLFLLEQGGMIGRFDGLMIDAGHTKELVLHDIREGMDLMKPGTLICGHDYHPSWPDNGVSQAVIELLPGHVNPIASIWAFQMP